MGISKVIVNNVTKVDLTSDTVATNNLVASNTAHNKAGNAVTGGIATKTSADLTASGATVTAPAGYYAADATKAVASGWTKVNNQTAQSDAGLSVSVNSSNGTITAGFSASYQLTPTVVNAGYITQNDAYAGTFTVMAGKNIQQTTKSAQTYTPGTTNQTIAAGQYLTGVQTIEGDANLVPENIAQGVNIFGVTGTHAGGSTEELYLNFYDYDGELLYSYEPYDVYTMTALPPNPTNHTLEYGLENEGWNWTLSEIKSMYGAGANAIDVGQIYSRTIANGTSIYVRNANPERYLWLQLYFSGTNTYIDVTSSGGETYSNVHYENQFGLIGPFNTNDLDLFIDFTVKSGLIEFKNNNTNCILRLDGNPDGYEYNRAAIDCIADIKLGNRVSIGDYAFYHCRYLETITIPNSQAIVNGVIGVHAFEGCTHLKHVNLPRGGLGSIGDGTFKNCKNLKVVALPGDAEFDIGEETFMNSGLEHTCLAQGIETIDVRAFKDSSLKHIGLDGYSTAYIFAGAFQNCSQFDGILTTWSDGPCMGEGMNQLSDYAFSGCLDVYKGATGSVVLPDTVWLIGEGLFYQSGIRGFQWPTEYGNSSITIIPPWFLKNCDYLEYIVIPEVIEEIDVQAFANCPSLIQISFYPTTPPTVYNSNAFANLPTNCKIYVPSGCLSAYTSATNYPSSSTYSYYEM